jgi:hypothetical protein
MGKASKRQRVRVLNCEEAAKVLRMSGRRVRVFLLDGRLKGRRLGKDWAILSSDLERFRRNRYPSLPPVDSVL